MKLAALISAFLLTIAGDHAAAADPPAHGIIHVAMLNYAPEAKSSICFGARFLELAANESTMKVDPGFTPVALGSATLFDHPFAVMTGEGAFNLTGPEVENLRRYLTQGGFLLASAGCGSALWHNSFEHALARAFPDLILPGEAASERIAAHPKAPRLVELKPDHAVFHTLFNIKDLTTKPPGEAKLLGLEIEGRLCAIYSPMGLNDTKSAPIAATPDPAHTAANACCCCGGTEILGAAHLCANALVYAVTR